MDYRLAVLFTVILPLILLIWAFAKRSEAIERLLIIYWRVSSLLAITVYLMIGNLPIAFMSGFLARILIPLGLWFWVDLNEEIDEIPQRPLKLSFTAWRWAVSIYSAVETLEFAAGKKPGLLRLDTKNNRLLWRDGDVFQMPVSATALAASVLIAGSGKNIYTMNIDPNNADVYIADAHDYVQASTVYRHASNGDLIQTFKAGVICTEFGFD